MRHPVAGIAGAVPAGTPPPRPPTPMQASQHTGPALALCPLTWEPWALLAMQRSQAEAPPTGPTNFTPQPRGHFSVQTGRGSLPQTSRVSGLVPTRQLPLHTARRIPET